MAWARLKFDTGVLKFGRAVLKSGLDELKFVQLKFQRPGRAPPKKEKITFGDSFLVELMPELWLGRQPVLANPKP